MRGKSMEERVFRSMLKTFDSIKTHYIVYSDHGSYISNDFPIEGIIEALKQLDADFEIRFKDEHYVNKTKSTRNFIYKDLTEIFEQIKPGEMIMVKIPEHLDIDKSRQAIVNHFSRTKGYKGIATHKVNNFEGDRRIQVYLAPDVTEEEPNEPQGTLPHMQALANKDYRTSA
jgi:hypothetical protein